MQKYIPYIILVILFVCSFVRLFGSFGTSTQMLLYHVMYDYCLAKITLIITEKKERNMASEIEHSKPKSGFCILKRYSLHKSSSFLRYKNVSCHLLLNE